MNASIKELVEKFQLQPHPEGGYFREVYRSELFVKHPNMPQDSDTLRRSCSLIYFLLSGDSFSAFHRVKWTDEIWHLYAGGSVELHVIDPLGNHSQKTITTNPRDGEPAAVIPAGCWQAARIVSSDDWALCGCSVAPGFEFEDFDMPPRKDLLEIFPQHADTINALTRR